MSAAGERRHLTVLFSDLVGSTEISAHLDAEDWHEVRAQYQRAAAAAVTRFGGYVAKYLGDGLSGVHELVAGLFMVEDRGAQQVKVIERPVQLYRAIQSTVARRHTHLPAPGIQTPFVGRE
jgi:class 3 adenylate cyclase